jgi:outer membrane protein assembly factor BamB
LATGFLPTGQAADWPQFRGPNASGVSSETGFPLQWSDTTNIVWKAELVGRGASSPIVWGDHVYVTAYTGYGLELGDPPSNLDRLQRHLLCFKRKDGTLAWKADTPTGRNREHPVAEYIVLHGYASSTPVADATGIYVYYGTSGVVAYGHDGRQKWHKPLGARNQNFGTASSPILYENLLIIHADIEAGALVALDKGTGDEVWRVATGDTDTWSTPLLVDHGGRRELVFHLSRGDPSTVAAVNPRDGSSLWQCRALKDYLCPSPIAHDGVIYVIAYQKGAAIRAGGRGEVTQSHLRWTMNKGSVTCTPLYHEGHLYWTNEESGIACCADAANGKIVYEERMRPPPGRIYASGVLADGRIYYVSREKGTYVVAAKPRFELLAHNVVESDRSIFNGTPALSQGQLFLRSDKYLYCIGKK